MSFARGLSFVVFAMCALLPENSRADGVVLTDPQFVLAGHTSDLWVAVFSPDGTRVLTASSDKTAKLWNAETG
ncbi:MAG: hypothetical protein J0I81_12515, partial [Hyphomicrobium sp.]|nr:hypothetical protein [Hyphomicrobium sp.]